VYLENFSVVVPTLNEVSNISLVVDELYAQMAIYESNSKFEIVFVDDGSNDGTLEELDRISSKFKNIVVVKNNKRLGLGASILKGINSASFERIVVIDADLTHPISEIPKMVSVSLAYDIVIGSRFCAGGGMDDRSKYLTSLIYNWMLRILLGTQVQDSICGFVCFQKTMVSALLTKENFHGYGDYFFWFLKGATHDRKSIVEVPVHYANRRFGKSKSNRWKMFVTYFISAVRCNTFYKKKLRRS
jgi:dolichol-phosphate mannosyltransferase